MTTLLLSLAIIAAAKQQNTIALKQLLNDLIDSQPKLAPKLIQKIYSLMDLNSQQWLRQVYHNF